MRHLHSSPFLSPLVSPVLGLALAGLLVGATTLTMRREGARVAARLDAISWIRSTPDASPRRHVTDTDPTLLVSIEEAGAFLASWQTIGGCGAGAGSGNGAGVKWIGRNVTGGSLNIQEQFSYTKLGTADYPERDLIANTLLTTDLGEKWSVGANIPLLYKYLNDPQHLAPSAPAVNYSNAGLGDVSVQLTRRLGSINATTLTGIVGLPTGKHDASFTPNVSPINPINQTAQLGFGKYTGSVVLDHTFDEVWGLMVVGGTGSWRGGKNEFDSYRAPTAAVYGYAGYFWGSFVPAFGMTLSGFKGHDMDQKAIQNTPLVALSANLSIEWSTPWIAVLLAGSVPYKWDGVYKDENAAPRSPWGFMPWTFALGIATAPF